MQFLIYFAVCVGSFLLSLQLFTSTTQKRPAEDLFFAELNRQAEASRPYSTQRHATKPARGARNDRVCARRGSSYARDGSSSYARHVSQLRPRCATSNDPTWQQLRPSGSSAAPDTTSAPVVAGQPKTQLVPKVVTNARAEAAPKKKRVARKYPRDDDPRNPIWWLWGLSDVR